MKYVHGAEVSRESLSRPSECGPRVGVPEQKQIGTELDKLENSLSELVRELSQLEDKLSPIRCNGSESGTCEKETVESLCPLAQTIKDKRVVVETAAARIQELLSTVEL